jgi:hypothetical protein
MDDGGGCRKGRRKEGSEEGDGGYSISPVELESRGRRKRRRRRGKWMNTFERQGNWPNTATEARRE